MTPAEAEARAREYEDRAAQILDAQGVAGDVAMLPAGVVVRIQRLIAAALISAAAEEREAAAKIAEAGTCMQGCGAGRQVIAAAIRARGK